MTDKEKIEQAKLLSDGAHLPTFADENEAADWFATHDTAPYMDNLEVVTTPIQVVRSQPKTARSQFKQPAEDPASSTNK